MHNLKFLTKKWCNLPDNASAIPLNDQFTQETFLHKISLKSVVQHSFLIPFLAVLLVGCMTNKKPSPTSDSTPITPSTQNKTAPQKTQVTSTQSPTPAKSLPTANSNGTKPRDGQTLVGVKAESDLRANLEKVYFPFDSYALTTRAQEKLLTMAQSMNNKRKLSIQISGHTDERGTEPYNFHLGTMRAQAVKEFLLAQGVNPQMLSTISYGETKPALKGSTSQAWQQNRRVEFHIVNSIKE